MPDTTRRARVEWWGDMLDVAQAIQAVVRERYEIQAALGEGGFGSIYKARQLATGQSVAIKMLRLPDGREGQGNEKRIARFQREMEICAQMHHPNIVRLIDSGRSDGELVYSVFEFLPGKNLAELLAEEGRLDPAEARHLMLQVLDALACAHGAGIVHRDLKPANIMVVPTGARRNALVLDFGIGALTEESRREEGSRLTLTNESIGTPSYAAPEQLRNQPLTPRSDLYAWGLVFLECLTGKRVVEGDTIAEVVFKQLSPHPIPIPDVIASHPVGQILRRITAKDPVTREATAEGLLRELETCNMSGLYQRTGPVRIEPLPADAATATVQFSTPQGRGQRLVEGERRQITALCCNLGAIGTAPSPVDVEELDHALGVQQEVCAEIATRFEGHITGALGESVLFYFGYPVAREDDALRAARAALAMATEVRRRSAVLEVDRKIRVDLRIGLHTGLVVARELREPTQSRLGFVVGTTPKLAARLAALPTPGGIVTSGSTQRLLRKQFALEGLGIRVFDDSTAPVEVFALREGAPSVGLRDVALVGRERELATLLEYWGHVRTGTGQAVLVSGEPGIGKSRLTRELADHISSEPHTWLECRATPDSAQSAFYPIVDLLDRLLDPSREVRPDGKLTKLEALLSLHGFNLSEAMPLFAPLLSLTLPPRWAPLDISPQKQRELTRNAVLSLLFEMAEKEPVALVIEDLHWADPSTLEFLGQLVGEVGSGRVFALFTARPEFAPPWPGAAVHPVQLGRFGRAESEQMAMKLIGGRTLPDEVLDTIAARTDGVPLFVEELVLTMIEAGALVEVDGRYTLTKPLSEVALPATLRDSLVARFDRLGRAKETAQIASSIGREFTFELLCAVSPLGETEVQEDLDRLVAAELVFRRRRLKNPAYIFKHALVRDAAYESMLKRSREGVHARIAKALEEKFPELVTERPELMAQHLAAAEQMRAAIGYAKKAAMGALVRSANVEAVLHARGALDWCHAVDNPEERSLTELGLNGLLTMGLMAQKGYASPDVAAALDRAAALLAKLGDNPHTGQVLWALFMYRHLRNHREAARDIAERLRSLAVRTGDTGLEVVGSLLLSQALYTEGRFAEARGHAERSLALYDSSTHAAHAAMYGLDSRVFAALTLFNLLWILGYSEQAFRVAQDSLAWARASNHKQSYLFALTYQAIVYTWQGAREEAWKYMAEVLEVSERYGLATYRAWGNIYRGWSSRNVELARQGISELLASGQEMGLPMLGALVAEVELEAGQREAALSRVEQYLDQTAQTQENYYDAPLLRLKAAALAEQNSEAAEACLRQAIEVAHSQSARMFELQARTDLARLLQRKGDAAGARAILRLSYEGFTEGLEDPVLRNAREVLAALT